MNRVVGSLALLILLWFCVPAAMADFAVRQASARLQNGVFFVDADIDLEFSDEALEALENGVPLTVAVEVTMRHEDAWFWERAVAKRELSYELRFHPLAGLYTLLDLETGIEERFATRDTAVATLGEQHGIPVVQQDRLETGSDYEMALRAYLDITSLPLPLQPLAYISPGWYLSTGWSRWRLRQ